MGRSGSQDSPPARRGSRGLPSSHRVTSERRNIVEVGDDESGRCGICSAPVLNRGVLDCCSHVFCFDCIDNWATVSNHCPLCKLQFRFISVESITRNCHQNGGDQFFPTVVKQEREDEPWGDEEALPFSFPSFFIDEDAVACLDGRRCLIRAGVPIEEDAADTSVACDSCDCWYHAGCVGFDPSISWGSWLCPRCSTMASSQLPPPRSFVPSALPLTTVVSSFSSGQVPMAELAYDAIGVSATDASVSISRADEGESALVFDSRRVAECSILPTRPNQPGKPITSKGTGEAPIAVKAEEVTFPSLGVEASSCQALGSLLFENQVLGGQELMESAITSNLQSPVEPVGNRPAEVRPSDQKSREPTNAPSTLFSARKVEQVALTQAEVRPSSQKSRVAATDRIVLAPDGRAEQIDLGQVEGGQGEERSKPDQSEGGKRNDLVAGYGHGVCPDLPTSYFDWAEGEAQADREFQEEIKGKKKQAKQDRDSIRAEDLPEPPRKVARNAAKRKEPVHGSSNRAGADKALPSTLKEDIQASGVKGSLSAVLEECELPYIESAPVEDLMNIVKDEHTGRIASNTASGPRTRIVMRRSTNGHAAQLVEDIRQQMRTAAGYGASDDLGKVEVSDDKFFAAYKGLNAEGESPCLLYEMQPSLNTSIMYMVKAALTRTNEQRRGANSRNVKRRRQSWTAKMLDQAPRGKAGGVRESLTKKLYAGGVSRKTWDRDWDIAFWKERSASLKKARQEAVNLVVRRGGDCGGESRRDGSVVKLEEEALLWLKDPDADNGDSILTRLYVADTSLLPRDEDIKPLLSLKGVKEEGKPSCSVVQEGTGKTEDLPALQTRTDMGLIEHRSVSKRGPTAGGVEASVGQLPIPSLQGFGKAFSVGGPGKIKEGTVTSTGVQYPHQTGHAGGSDKITCMPSKTSCSPPPSDEKKDKRQWALELLARKSGDATASSSGKSGAGIKKESSLLSQVPYELKPTLALDCRSRVPTAVRQLQLNRLLEHHLRKAKLASLHAGYKLKSVIAAAVAKEVEIYGHSNSKGVYVNLCVRALSQQDEVPLQVSIPPPFNPGQGVSITEALLATGLISDSPPGSPSYQHNTSMKGSSELSKHQTNADVSTSSNALKISETSVGSGGVLQNFPTSSPVISLATAFMPQFQQDEADDVLELAIPQSIDLYTDLDLDLEEFGPAGTGSKLSESVSSGVDSSSKKLKVLLTTDIKCSHSEVLEHWHNLPKEAGLIRVNKSLESKNTGTPTLQPSPSENVLESTTVFRSPEGSELITVENRAKSPAILNQSRETERKTSTDKVGKAQQISANTIPSRDREGSKKSISKEGKVENTTGDPAETCRDGEFEGDDWMRSGKFPDLESRIDKMRKDVLQMNSTFLSQFGEAHVFGGSIDRPAPILEKMQDGGFEGHTSMQENYDKSERSLDTGVSDGPGSKTVKQSVRKQVESYVKEHVKPLYKSGVIQSEQFRYAVSKTASKVMQHHGDAKSADFLILEGSKVKKLADQYLQAFVHRK